MKTACLAAFFGVFAFQVPVRASQAPNAPLGIVGNANAAKLGSSPTSEGATVYSGEALSTDGGGVLQVRIGAISFGLESNSTAHVYRAPYGAVLELTSGSVIYSTPGNS